MKTLDELVKAMGDVTLKVNLVGLERYVARMGVEHCDWDPERDARAVVDGPGCKREATVSLGNNPNWHLCEECSRLPRFKRFRKRTPIGSARGSR
jgi:hypothetical protein